MAAKKSGWIVNPKTTLVHNGKAYKGGSVIEDMTDEEIAKLPFGTLVPATGKEIGERVAADLQMKVDAAKARVDAARAALEAIKKAEADRVSTYEKDIDSAQLHIDQAEKELHEAEQAKVKAEAESKPEPVETPKPAAEGGKKK